MNIIKAIVAINPNANVSIEDNDVDQITWLNGTAVISKSDIETKLAELQAAFDAKDYQRKRKTAYDLLNQFELISDDAINGTTTHKDAVLAIKVAHPKP